MLEVPGGEAVNGYISPGLRDYLRGRAAVIRSRSGSCLFFHGGRWFWLEHDPGAPAASALVEDNPFDEPPSFSTPVSDEARSLTIEDIDAAARESNRAWARRTEELARLVVLGRLFEDLWRKEAIMLVSAGDGAGRRSWLEGGDTVMSVELSPSELAAVRGIG